MHDPAPSGPRRNLGLVRVDLVPVVLPTASVDVDLGQLEPTGSLPKEPDDPEDDDDGHREPVLEEDLHVQLLDGVVELRPPLVYGLRNGVVRKLTVAARTMTQRAKPSHEP